MFAFVASDAFIVKKVSYVTTEEMFESFFKLSKFAG